MMLRIGRRKPTEDFNQLLLIKKEVGKSKNDDGNNDVLSGQFHDHQHNKVKVPTSLLQQLQVMQP